MKEAADDPLPQDMVAGYEINLFLPQRRRHQQRVAGGHMIDDKQDRALSLYGLAIQAKGMDNKKEKMPEQMPQLFVPLVNVHTDAPFGSRIVISGSA